MPLLCKRQPAVETPRISPPLPPMPPIGGEPTTDDDEQEAA